MALNTDPNLNLSFSATLDDDAPQFRVFIGQADKPGDLPPTWPSVVVDGVWTSNLTFPLVEKGEHVLRYRANSPEVYLEKIVLDTGNHVGHSYLGPPETRIL